MRKTWRLLRAHIAGLLTYGCAPHAFNLHAKDICAMAEFKKTVDEVNSVIVYFAHNIQAGGLATLRIHQIDLYRRTKALAVKPKARWGAQLDSAVSLVNTKDALVKTVNNPSSRCKELPVFATFVDGKSRLSLDPEMYGVTSGKQWALLAEPSFGVCDRSGLRPER
jgi:hypothetical protein